MHTTPDYMHGKLWSKKIREILLSLLLMEEIATTLKSWA